MSNHIGTNPGYDNSDHDNNSGDHKLFAKIIALKNAASRIE